MYRENYINALRSELIALVEQHISPIALKYEYSKAPLESNIKWRPLVLILGNYSSGKSTLINEYLGNKIQRTGQAPTDDSFTVITYGDPEEEGEDTIRVVDERDGKFLLNDPEFPFALLKRHGERFASHFRLKKVNSPFLKNLAIIDTPGMLDSITERDRGYNYQDVIGDFAQISDLVLVMFDPHKAGTVREAYTSLRDTLPDKTFEDRVLFVLNRIDECTSMIDLIKVYGTLCWNLSQMTGRKDIPTIRLTYSSAAFEKQNLDLDGELEYLTYLENQREELKEEILEAPRHRLDHLASFVENHSGRLSHLTEALINYKKKLRSFKLKYMFAGIFTGLFASFGALAGIILAGLPLDPYSMGTVSIILFLLWLFFWSSPLYKRFLGSFNSKCIKNIDELTDVDSQTRKDSWISIKDLVIKHIKKTSGNFSLVEVKREFRDVKFVFEDGSKDIRKALNEISSLKKDQEFVIDPENPILSSIIEYD